MVTIVPSQPLRSELVETSTAILSLGSEVAKLQEEVNATQGENGEEEEEEQGFVIMNRNADDEPPGMLTTNPK